MLASGTSAPFCQIPPEDSMRFPFCLLLTLLPAQARQSEMPVIEVYVPPVLGSADAAFQRARITVTGIFSELGMKVEWRMPSADPPECCRNPARISIVVALA